MNKYRVTCLLGGKRVFATRRKFETREEASAYAGTVADSRKPMVGYCQFETEYTSGHWCVHHPDEYDGAEDGNIELLTLSGDRFDELQAVWDFCELYNHCMVSMYGVPCGGTQSIPDEAGSGYLRCSGCGML